VVSETLWYLAGIVFILLGIGFSIGLHELGHLVPAKLFGVKVTKYMIGFGPTLYSKQIGETEYGIKGIPLGGYIAMLGMYPPSKKEETKKGFFQDMITQARLAHSEHEGPGDANRKFYQLSVGKRIVVMLGGPFMNLVLGVLLTVIALSGFGIYQSSQTVQAVSICLEGKDECDLANRTPAAIAGLEAKDKVLAVNGEEFTSWDRVREQLATGQVAEFLILRNGEELTIPLTATLQQRPSFDSFGNPIRDESGEIIFTAQPFIGVVLEAERRPLGISDSLMASASNIYQIGQLILDLPVRVYEIAETTFTGSERDPNGPISIVGIGQIAGEVASSDQAGFVDKFATGIQILGSLNFALFVFNMIPLLPLDGGHVAGGIYESIKRSIFRLSGKKDPGPADTALLMPLTWGVFILLLGVSLVLIVADLVNPVSIFG
jgi:membrane-associated protease RseP (regulator of RpoE activity)